MLRRLTPVLLAAVLAVSWAAPAFATAYGSRSDPVMAEDNTDDGNAWIYGKIFVDQQTDLKDSYYYRDSAPGPNGNQAYAKTNWYYWLPCAGGPCFASSGEDRAASTHSGSWIYGADYDELDSRADKGRGLARVCEDQSWSPDACSKAVTVTLSY